MADKNWQAGSGNLIPATAVVCLVAIAVPLAGAWGASGGFAPASYVGSLDPNTIWELLIGGIVVASFLGAVGIWVNSALRWHGGWHKPAAKWWCWKRPKASAP